MKPPVDNLLYWSAILLRGIRWLVAGLVILFFSYMTLAVLVQVGGRYLFDYAIDWTAETATFAQIWMIFLAAGLAMRESGNHALAS